jgi:hypothetical protein
MKPKVSVHAAVLSALNTKWMTEIELVRFVKSKTGVLISGSSATARARDLRKPQYGSHPVTCRYLDQHNGRRRWEYGIAE